MNEGYAYRAQVDAQAAGLTLLDYLSRRWPHSTPEEWSGRIDRGEVQLDGSTPPAHALLSAGQLIVWHRQPWDEPPVPLSYDVLHEDEAVVAVAKPSGLPTMPAGGFLTHTLLALVRQRWPHARPLHRLGRHTSGVVLFARTSRAASVLAAAWREHAVLKRYRALASGVAVADEYTITSPIGPVPHRLLGSVHAAASDGKPSHSVARVLERRAAATLFEVDIKTGRPHQIRIHLAFVGHPLVNDPLYGVGGVPHVDTRALPGDGGYLLHAERVRFTHPMSGTAMEITAPPPAVLRLGAGNR